MRKSEIICKECNKVVKIPQYGFNRKRCMDCAYKHSLILHRKRNNAYGKRTREAYQIYLSARSPIGRGISLKS